MFIPQGEWVVVERRVSHANGRPVGAGMRECHVIKAGLTERSARVLAAEYAATQERQLREGTQRIVCDYWAMKESEV